MIKSYQFNSFPEVSGDSRIKFWEGFLSLIPGEVLSAIPREQQSLLRLNSGDDFGEPYYLWKVIQGMDRYEKWWESENGIIILRMITQHRTRDIFDSFPNVAEIWVGKSTKRLKSSGLLIKAFNPDRNNGSWSLHIGDAENWKTYWF